MLHLVTSVYVYLFTCIKLYTQFVNCKMLFQITVNHDGTHDAKRATLTMKIAYRRCVCGSNSVPRNNEQMHSARSINARAMIRLFEKETDYSNTGYAFKHSSFYPSSMAKSAYKMLYDEHKTGT